MFDESLNTVTKHKQMFMSDPGLMVYRAGLQNSEDLC